VARPGSAEIGLYHCPVQPDPIVSVVIVNWNTRQFLLDCIASMRSATTRTSTEIIVVDNASHDGSQQALREAYPDVKLIENSENLGFAKANNIGFADAQGRAFCIVNTDVIALDGVIDRLWEYVDTHPNVGMVGPRTLNRDMEIRRNCRRFPALSNALGDYLWLKRLLPRSERFQGRALPLETYQHTHDAEVLSGCFLMVRRDAIEQVGALDEDFFFYGEDTDWCKRFHDAGWGIVYLPQAEAIHFGGGSTAAYPVKYYLTMEKADLLYWQKHSTPRRRAAYVAIKVVYHVVSVPGWLLIWLSRPTRRPQASLRLRGHLINTMWLLTRRSLA
jgi:GT2 family glycosyltransferase